MKPLAGCSEGSFRREGFYRQKGGPGCYLAKEKIGSGQDVFFWRESNQWGFNKQITSLVPIRTFQIDHLMVPSLGEVEYCNYVLGSCPCGGK